MTTEALLLAIGGVGGDLAADAAVLPKKRRAWPRRLAAAVFALVLLGAVSAARQLNYFSSGCSAWPGVILGDAYYYNVSHSGLWRWTEADGSQRVFRKLWTDGWLVTGDAYYYNRGLTLYRRDMETGKSAKLYRLSRADATHFGYEAPGDGSLVLTVYNRRKEYKYQLRIDARTGELLETLTDRIPYSDRFTLLWTTEHPRIGSRELTLVSIGGSAYTRRYDLLEDGVSLLPEGTCVTEYASPLGEYTTYRLFPRDFEETDAQYEPDLLVLRPDGNDVVIPAPAVAYQDAVGDWLYYVHQEDGVNEVFSSVRAYNMASGEDRELEVSEDWQFYALETDGTVMFTCVPWGEAQTRWRVEYDAGGSPAALELLDEDITGHR